MSIDNHAALGNTTDIVSEPSGHIPARRRRYARQGAAGRLLDGWRVSWCLKRWGEGKTGIALKSTRDTHKAYFSGLAVCGSVWTCPVCASKITETRRQDLTAAVTRKGLTKVLVTVTLAHARSDSLAGLIGELNDALRRMKQGRWWGDFKERWSLAAYVSSLEITYGENGWHPHKHWLLFLTLPESDIDQEQLKGDLTARYKALLAKHGRYASDLYGIDVRIGDDKAGEYVGKWSLEAEVTKSTVKEGREGGLSPFQLLDLYLAGDAQAGALFVEYAQATEGKRQLVWSKGARKVLGLGEEVSDEEAAQIPEVEEDEVLFTFDWPAWSQVLKHDARVKVLEAAERGRLDLLEYLASIGALAVGDGG